MSTTTFQVKRTQTFKVPQAPNFVRDAGTDAPTDVAELSDAELGALADAMRADLFANARRRREGREMLARIGAATQVTP